MFENPSPRLIAFYLPQYHPIPENDEWWGKGFTEWTNVAKAKPLFKGHYQPHLPTDLGFYDLRLPEVRQAQADMAREAGIHGFCYYHYWFNGKQLLERPFQEVLQSGQPDFPFCLCWANENWSRTWDGKENHILIRQVHSDVDDRKHFLKLIPALSDKRYIRYEGKPLFLVYDANFLPDPNKTADTWREVASKEGLGDIFLCKVEREINTKKDPRLMGFDAAIEFQPDWNLLQNKRLRRTIPWRILTKLRLVEKAYALNRIFDYEVLAQDAINKGLSNYPSFLGVTPRWDNSPRRKTGAVILKNSNPQVYENWLYHTILKSSKSGSDSPLIFINAWNEWGEGNYLEPDDRYGLTYLEATKSALESACKDIEHRKNDPYH